MTADSAGMAPVPAQSSVLSPQSSPAAAGELLLEVRNLRTEFALDEGTVRAVDGVSYKLYRGRTLGIVGESGCGKSVTAQSIMRIVPRPGKIIDGEIIYHRRRPTTLVEGGSAGLFRRRPAHQSNGHGGADGQAERIDLTQLDPMGREIRAIRGGEIALIFQEPLS